MLISVELLMMLFILLFIPETMRGRVSSASPSVSRSGSRAANRGGHFHQDCRYRLRPDEDRLQNQGRRRAHPGVIADCTGTTPVTRLDQAPTVLRPTASRAWR